MVYDKVVFTGVAHLFSLFLSLHHDVVEQAIHGGTVLFILINQAHDFESRTSFLLLSELPFAGPELPFHRVKSSDRFNLCEEFFKFCRFAYLPPLGITKILSVGTNPENKHHVVPSSTEVRMRVSIMFWVNL